MVYFLYGEDTFRSRQKLDEIRAKYHAKNDEGDFGSFDCSESDGAEKCKAFFDTAGLFASKKLLIIQNPFAYTGSNMLSKMVSREDVLVDRDKVIVMVSVEAPKKKEWKFLLEKPVISEVFLLFKRTQIGPWMHARAKELGIVLDSHLTEKLTSTFGADLWTLDAELKKFSLLGRTNIGLSDALSLAEYPGTSNVFDFAEAFWKKDSRALTLLEEMTSHDESADHLAGLLISQSRTMLLIMEGQKPAGHPFYISKLTTTARALGKPALHRMHKDFAAGERSVRSGRGTWEHILAAMCAVRTKTA